MALVVRDAACGYGAGPVVRGVGFALEPGGVVCVLGPNGVGKTTLFKAVLGLLPLDEGAVEIDGRPLARMGRAEVARAVAYVPQSQQVPFSYTVEEFVLMGRAPHLRLLQQPGPEDRALARQALADMGVGHLAKKTCTEVSGGELQMAAIARALAQQPRYLVMDEPTASLDFGNKAKVLERVLELAQAGIGVLMTTHDPGQAFALRSDVVLLRRGEAARPAGDGAPAGEKDADPGARPCGTCTCGPCDEVLTAATLSDVYGTEVVVGTIENGATPVRTCSAVVHGRAGRG